MSQSPTSSSSSSSSSHAIEEAILATHNSEKEKPRLNIDLNRPLNPQIIEEGDIQIEHDQMSEEGDLITVEKNQGVDHHHDIEGSINNKAMRGFDDVEASTSLSKRKRFTVEEKGKRKVDCFDHDHDDDGWLELRLGPLHAVERT
ncbi:hypothetical protein ACOSQ2_008837 [Xanthoceras sorbifolium]